jgi:hypothetical protein
MCQQIVTLFIDLQNDNSKKVFKEKYMDIVAATQTMDPELLYRKMATHLLYKKVTGHHLAVGEIDDDLATYPKHEVILGHFMDLIQRDAADLPCACNYMPTVAGPELSVRDFYVQLLHHNNIPADSSVQDTSPLTVERSAFYFALVHMIILNMKGDILQKSKKLVQL